MRVSTSQLYMQGLSAIQDTQAGMLHTQSQISSGNRILQPADDPAGSARLVSLQQSLALSQQYRSNGSSASSQLSTEDSVLTSVTNLLQGVRNLAVQANNPALTQSDRNSIASQVSAQLDQLVALANSKNGNGGYLFSGTAVQTAPFTRQPDGSVAYAGDQGTQKVSVAPGYDIAAGDPGSSVFQDIPNGNGTFTVSAGAGNTGSAVSDQGSVTNPGAWDGGTYTLHFAAATGAGPALTFNDAGNNDNLGYSLSIDGTVVYSVSESGTPINTVSGLAAQINASEGTTGVHAYVDNGSLYLSRNSPSPAPIVVTESMSGASNGDADTVTGYFGSHLTGASNTTSSTSLVSASHYVVTDGSGTQVAAGAWQSASPVAFSGITTTITGTPGLGDAFTVSSSQGQDVFTTMSNLVAALQPGAAGTQANNAARGNALNRVIADLDGALQRVQQVQTGVGARLNAIDNQTQVHQDVELTLQQDVSSIKDVDMAKAISLLTSQQTALQAAQRSFVVVQGLSLFNYMPATG